MNVRGEPSRQTILAAVRADPGMSKSELRDATGIAWGALSHHLDRLETDGTLESFEWNGRHLVFPPDLPHNERLAVATLREPLSNQVLARLTDARPPSLRALAREMDVGRKVIRRIAANLESAGLLDGAPGRRHRQDQELALVALLRTVDGGDHETG